MTNTGRELRNSMATWKSLKDNNLYNFSKNHTLAIYPLNAVCSYIQKNACTTLKWSITKLNGFLDEEKDPLFVWNWVQRNHEQFIASEKEIALADYTFIVLRCPFRRLASCFLDKFVGGEHSALDEEGNKINFSFNDFLKFIMKIERVELDEHYRPQIDFLHYLYYDDYFSVERFDEASKKLTEKGLPIVDTRKLPNHYLTRFDSVEGEYSKTKASEIKKMRDTLKKMPSYRSMFQPEEIDMVQTIYAEDIYMYKEVCLKKDLLFNSYEY